MENRGVSAIFCPSKMRLPNHAGLGCRMRKNLFSGGGIYTTYEVKLNIKRGHINPSLDILALREVGKVRAGVKVTGTVEFPDITLYSPPTMPEKEILGYIFLGRRMRTEQPESDIIALETGALLPQGPEFSRRLRFTDVDLGRLFSEKGVVRLRYRLRKNLEVEFTLGDTSGVDFFHVIEFE